MSKFKVGDKVRILSSNSPDQVKEVILADSMLVFTDVYYLDITPGPYMEHELELDKPISLPIGAGNSISYWSNINDKDAVVPQRPITSCTCGAHKVYGLDSPHHSHWCDTYLYYEKHNRKTREEIKNDQ